MAKLKPCPSCKCTDNSIVSIPDPEFYDKAFIECVKCHYSTGDKETIDEAIAFWNAGTKEEVK